VPLPPFERLIDEHGDVVRRVCRALLGPADADDAWADTFLSALRAYPDLRDSSNLRGWLVTIAHRKAVDVARRQTRARPTERLPDAGRNDHYPVESDGTLLAAVAALPDKQREAVTFHHVAGLPYADVARLTGTTPAAARRAAADGIAGLRRTLTPEEAS
jgi:RNA polymerase sigma factor (sigma-70 family)